MKKTLSSFIIAFFLTAVLLYLKDIGSIFISDVDANFLGSFIQVIGTLFGIMAAFVVYLVYDRYNRILETAERETDSLSELYSLITYLEDDKLNKKIKILMVEYAEMVINRGWLKLHRGKKSNQASRALFRVYEMVRSIKSSRKRFPIIFGQMVEKYEDVSNFRTQRVSMSAEHLPKSLKALLVFDSIILVLSVVLLPVSNFLLSIFIVFATTVTVVLSLQVIFDLDDPLAPGEWQLSPQAFKDLIQELNEMG